MTSQARTSAAAASRRSAEPARPSAYPIEVEFPDIGRWAPGNTGTPYVWTFDSGTAGPHIGIQALTHGNEVCGALALDFLLAARARPIRGKLSLVFANVAAYQRWNRDEPFKSRFVDEDFNRLWSPAVLDGGRESAELARARALRAHYDALDCLLDIHSMSDRCPPLMLAGTRRKGIELALALGIPEYVIVDAGHAAGRRLRDYGRFDDPDDPRTALLVECGQHWSRDSARVAIQTSLRVLRHFELAAPEFLQRHLDRGALPPQRLVQVTESVPIKSERFRFLWPHDDGLTVVPRAGSVIANDGGVEIRTPYDDCVLVMPMRRAAKPGDTAVRLGRFLS